MPNLSTIKVLILTSNSISSRNRSHVPDTDGDRSIRPGRPEEIPPIPAAIKRLEAVARGKLPQTPGMNAAQVPSSRRRGGSGDPRILPASPKPVYVRLRRNLGHMVQGLGNLYDEPFNRNNGTRTD